MRNTHLCLATNSQFRLPQEEQVVLFADRGFDGFFANWKPGVDLMGCRRAAEEHHLLFQSVHAPFGHAGDFWEGDEEFAPRLRFLWDENALQYLRFETMHMAASLLIKFIKERM